MSNFLFYSMMFLSVFVSISSSSWMVCWMMMEVSSFFFVPILFGLWSVSSSLISLKYFLVQSIGSSIFLFSFMWESFYFGGFEWMSGEKGLGLLALLSMMVKLGVFPFSGWMLHISENLSWKNFFLLSSIQEVIPLIMVSKFGGGGEMVFLFVCLGMLTLMVFCFSNFSVHWMMIISSLFNICWMIVASIMSKESLIFFFSVYFSTLFILFSIFESIESFGSLTSMGSFTLFKGGKVVFVFISFLVMGMPPMGSFLGKVEILNEMIMSDMKWMSMYFLVVSSIFMFLYLKISLYVSLSVKSGWANSKISYFSILIFSMTFSIFLFWMLYF